MPWPNHDLNLQDHDLSVTQHAFPVGNGLNAGAKLKWVALAEDPIEQPKAVETWVFDKGMKDLWRLYVGDDFDWSVVVGPRGAKSARGELSMTVVDRRVQGDARRIEFAESGEHLSQVYF